ncbi:lipopolysaccharide biosynthesis protein, partial [bacterium]|nr:lipopolysaccharide biosynthesis protein [bacterium]
MGLTSAVDWKVKTGIRRAYESKFLRSVLILCTGSALAQTVSVACTPVITRLYSPSDIGKFGVYLSIVGMIAPVITLRYEAALILPREDKASANLAAASLISAGVLSALVAVLLLAGWMIGIPVIHHHRDWLVILPFSCLIAAVAQTLYAWSTRRKMFRRNSVSQVCRSMSMNGYQMAAGFAISSPLGLIVGNMLGDAVACVTLLGQTIKGDLSLIRHSLSWTEIRHHAGEYKDFPLYNAPQHMLSQLSQCVPILLLSAMYSPAIAGFYSITTRTLQMPMNLVMESLRQVYYQRTSEMLNSGNIKGVAHSMKRTTLALLGLAAIPTVAVALWGEGLYSLVLGAKWATAGTFAGWIVLWYAALFANLPAVCTLH